jgi:pimeloyl-ACP methyl ester carboxylesterase
MTSFVLVPGAGGRGWYWHRYWHRVVAELGRRGHTAVAVDLPAGDDAAGLAAYTDAVLHVLPAGEPVLVAQSMGGLTAPLVAVRAPVAGIVLVNAMVPRPGETGGDWWTATGQADAQAGAAAREGRPFDPDDLADAFLHDLPAYLREHPEVTTPTAQSGTPFTEPWPLAAWPDVPTRVLAGRDDRFFPPEFQRRVAAERLGLPVEEVPGGHLVALSRPGELVERLLAPAWEPGPGSGRDGGQVTEGGTVGR